MSSAEQTADVGVRTRATSVEPTPADRPVVRQPPALRHVVHAPLDRRRDDDVYSVDAARAALDQANSEYERAVRRRTAAWRAARDTPSPAATADWHDAEIEAASAATALEMAEVDYRRARGALTTLDASPLMHGLGNAFRAFSGPAGLLALRRR